MTNQKSNSSDKNKMSYKDSGVDVQTGDDFVDWIHSQNQNMPHQGQIVEGIGGFASLFRLNTKGYQSPCIVSCTDGVGTKVKLASQFGLYSGIGQDLVAMCVNDLICTGGDPLFFLDYLAMGKLDLNQAQQILLSVKKACVESHLALIGGETAEMPGVYISPDFDCAGFAIGIVDENKRFGAHKVSAEDVLIGLPSSGFHSNGYSLLRKVFEKDINDYYQELLIPTRLYVSVIDKLKNQFDIKAVAHITGGGMDNIPRVIPKDMIVHIKEFEFPKLFKEVQKRTGLSVEEMLKTLNCGVGMVVVVSASDKEKVLQYLISQGESPIDLGVVKKRHSDQTQEWLYGS